MAFKIEPLDSRKHIRSGFSCGSASLDDYLQQRASQDLKKRVATVFVLIDEPQVNILGYYSLSSFTIDISAVNQSFAKNLPRYPLLPATLLGRLAIDNRQQGKRLGELLLMDALKKAVAASVQVASLAVIAEALDEKAVNFYMKYGFERFNQNPMKLYLPMKTIESLF